MTSASELFSNWRSRSTSRNPNPNLAVAPPAAAGRTPAPPPTASLKKGTDNNSNSVTVTSRVNQLNLIRSGQRHKRLPGTVLQARARLIERLCGISLTGNRENITASAVSRSEFLVDNDFEFIDSGDWEIGTPRGWIEFDMQLTDLSC